MKGQKLSDVLPEYKIYDIDFDLPDLLESDVFRKELIGDLKFVDIEEDVNDLKPCPFCNMPPERKKQYADYIYFFAVACFNEECPAQPMVSNVTQELADRDWNHRPREEELEEKIIELQKIIKYLKERKNN